MRRWAWAIRSSPSLSRSWRGTGNEPGGDGIGMTDEHRSRKKRIVGSLHHVPSLRETLARMHNEEKISKTEEAYIKENLDEWVEDSKYILLNLGVHIGIGFVRFTAIPLPLPIGTIMRPIWVGGNRVFYTLRHDPHRKGIHSLKVLLFSAIPFLGYLAYTIPLRKKSEYLTYLYAQHVSYGMYNKTIEEKLKKAPSLIKKIGHAILIPHR
jgi:hypothetical protein